MFKFCTQYVIIAISSVMFCGTFLAIPIASAQDSQIAKRWMTLVKYDSQDRVLMALKWLRPDLKPAQSDPVMEAKVRAIFTQIDSQYRQLFPDLMRNKAFPDYVIVESETIADEFTYTTNEIENGAYNGFVAIPRGPLSDPKGYSSVIGILSHELAHLYLNHHNISETALKWWRSSDPSSGIDESSQSILKEYLENSSVAGSFINEALVGAPLDQSLLQSSFADLMRQLISTFGNTSCVQGLGAKLTAKTSFMSRDFSYFDWGVKFPNSQEANKVQSELTVFESELISCSKSVGFDGNSLRWKLLPLNGSPVFSENYLSSKFNEFFDWAGKNEFEVLFRLGKLLHSEMRQQVSKAHLDQVRWRSFEDEADEFSVTILRSLKLPQTEFARSLVSIFESREPGLTARCEAAIAGKAEIPFGYLSDPHHSACYRLQTVKKLAVDSEFSAKP